ncbi:MAG: hypothetical protein U9R15_14710, partial [Chloroflexota bacterium]|nr:hypothetical protein [Chloroflexota bacterium]
MKTSGLQIALTLSLTLLLIAGSSPQAQTAARAALPAHVQEGTPSQDSSLLFVENVGQFDERARFQVRGGAGTMWLAEDALWISITEHAAPSEHPAVQTCQHADLQLADLQPANL